MIYTLMRLALFVVTYAVLAGAWIAVVGKDGLLLVPFIGAVVVSSLLSMRLLARQREEFARTVQARAERMTHRYEQLKSREDVD